MAVARPQRSNLGFPGAFTARAVRARSAESSLWDCDLFYVVSAEIGAYDKLVHGILLKLVAVIVKFGA
jgi:hypothetical protein